MRTVLGFALAFGLALAGPAASSTGAPGPPIAKVHRGSAPGIGTRSQAVQGEVIYSEFNYNTQATATLPVAVKFSRRARLESGALLRGFVRKDEPCYCALEPDYRVLGLPTPTWFCLAEGRPGHFTRRFIIPDGGPVSRGSTTLPKPIPYEGGETLLTETGTEGPGLRQEFVFAGAAGGVLRILYREYVDDLARPAFTQELSYELDDQMPMEISALKARFEVFAAGNSGIEYRVVRGLE